MTAAEVLYQTVSIVDRMATNRIIYRNTAGRYKSRTTSRLARTTASC